MAMEATAALTTVAVATVAVAMLAATAMPARAGGFSLTSPDIVDGGRFAAAQVNTRCGGADRSPALAWSGAPAGTKSFAITIFDRDAPTGHGWWHWAVSGIPRSVRRLPAGTGTAGSPLLPAGAVEGRNDFGTPGYGGPGPPHHYEITVYALRTAHLRLAAGTADATVAQALQPDTLARAVIVGQFGMPR
jgi:Raf kinase inhibitor-like YbhB/YbcL family protein